MAVNVQLIELQILTFCNTIWYFLCFLLEGKLHFNSPGLQLFCFNIVATAFDNIYLVPYDNRIASTDT